MSTRSGKRIHSSFHESTIKVDLESAVKSERKTRSSRLKENVDEHSVSLFKGKKRHNYVSYPTDDEKNAEELTNNDNESRNGRKLRRNTLKEQNIVVQDSENVETMTEPKNLIRKSRRGKKNVEEQPENLENVQIQVTAKLKSKNNKKKSEVKLVNEDPAPIIAKKSKRKKKKSKQSNSLIVEEVQPTDNSRKNTFDKSMSMESFHSAAGSPKPIYGDEESALLGFAKDTTFGKTIDGKRKSSIRDSTSTLEEAMAIDADTTLQQTNITKSIQQDAIFENNSISVVNPRNIFDTDGDTDSIASNNEFADRKSNINNGTFDKLSKIVDTTFEKYMGNDKKNSSYDMLRNTILDSTSEKDTGSSVKPKKKKLSVQVATVDKKENVDEKLFEKYTLPTSQKTAKRSLRKSNIEDTTFEKMQDATTDIDTIQRSSDKSLRRKLGIKDITFDTNEIVDDTTFEKDPILTPPRSKKSLSRHSSGRDTTFSTIEKVKETTFEKITTSTQKSAKKSLSRQSSVKDTTFDMNDNNVDDTTFEKDKMSTTLQSAKTSLSRQSSVKDTTFDKNENADDKTFEKDTTLTLQSAKTSLSRQSSVKDTTFDKSETFNNVTFEKDTISSLQNSAKKGLKRVNSEDSDNIGSSDQTIATNKTFEDNTTFNSDISEDDDNNISNLIKKRKSGRFNTCSNDLDKKQKSTIKEDSRMDSVSKTKSPQNKPKHAVDDHGSKLNSTYERNSKSSLISSDNSEIEKSYISCISITDDESEHLADTTPVLIESSMDNSCCSKQDSPAPQTPLKREGTFTKDGPEVLQHEYPSEEKSLSLAGCTPYHVTKSSQKRVLNITRSIEKGRLSSEPPRMTRVMFCSPVDNPTAVGRETRKIIKSNLKGSNKSFVFDDSVCGPSSRPALRKRSYTQSDADDARAKRSRLADQLQHSVDRLSRPRTSSAAAKLTEPTTPSKKPATPSKSKSDARSGRTKLPNFAALHQRQFSKMESLRECQERRAKRARQLLTPTGAVNMLERISPKETITGPPKPREPTKKTDTPTKLPTLESLRPGFTRFGFKLNLDVNPFSVPSKHPEPKPKPDGAKQSQALPSLAGATSVRREVAKQAVMREKSFTDRRNAAKRNENRTIIKGVRTNRRFELQMKMRNVE